MSKQDDGGPAFPSRPDEQGGAQFGMSLRDWFAGQAMQGLCVCDSSSTEPEDWDYDILAECAYKAADALLRARAVDGGGR